MNAIVADRGQVTIPKALRERLGIAPRTVVAFHEEGGRLWLTKVVTQDPVSQVRGCLSGKKTTDEWMAELRGVR